MKKTYIKVSNWLLSGILTLMGFSTSCDKNGGDDNGGGLCMYGTPTADHTIKGKVVNQRNEAVPDIQIIVTPEGNNKFPLDTVYTKESGEYIYNKKEFAFTKYTVSVKDNDGEKNGLYQDKDTTITITKADYTKPNKGWYQGEAEKIVNITLQDKKSE